MDFRLLQAKLDYARSLNLKPIIAMKYVFAKELERQSMWRVIDDDTREPEEKGHVRRYTGITVVINNDMDEDWKVYTEF